MTNSSVTNGYDASIAYLYGRINYEQVPAVRPRKLNLDNMRLLLERLGSPHLQLPVVHITGTKGKGSTSAMLASILTHAGYRTGLYTSPHLTCLEERYVVDGVRCLPNELVALTEKIRPVVDEVDREIQSSNPDSSLTFFEITTAIAWLHFLRKQVDIAVLEVGMGGRLDSTNLCRPVVTVITSISFDHTKQLGNTLAAIAGEKAGIIKPGVPVISGVEHPEAQAVIQQVAGKAAAPLLSLGVDFQVRSRDEPNTPGGADLHNRLDFENLRAPSRNYFDVEVNLLGDHQRNNAALALAAAQCLQDKGWQIEIAALRRGLADVTCAARIEVIRRNPTVVVDSAHNVASIAALIETMKQHFAAPRRTLIFAASRDKDVQGMLQLLVSEFHEMVLTQFMTNPRAVDANQLASMVRELANIKQDGVDHPQMMVLPNPLDAWQYCRARSSKDQFICVTGSFFLAAELRPQIQADAERTLR